MSAPVQSCQPIPDHPECWMARGVGSEYNLTCLATGKTADLMPNVSGFVQGREAGERVVALFNGRARLDFRKHEPEWVQVKVGCLPEHEEVLHRLCQASWGCHGLLNERIIKWAIDPVQFPGGQPRALERANANAAEAATLKARIQELESNAREQAKLLADTGRRVEEMESALRQARAFINPEADPPRISNRTMVRAIDAALSSGESGHG